MSSTLLVAIGAGIAVLTGIGAGLGTVSYTHLDVYKRQGFTMPTMIMTDSRADLTMRIQTVKIQMKMILNPIMMIVTCLLYTSYAGS